MNTTIISREKAEEAKERANEKTTRDYDIVSVLCPACHEPVVATESTPGEFVPDETDGEYGNDKAAFEFSPARLQDSVHDNPWDTVHIVPREVEMVNEDDQLQVFAYKHDHSSEGYQAWQTEVDALNEVDRRAEENKGLGEFTNE